MIRAYAEWANALARMIFVPCNYGCGASLPFGDDAASQQARCDHYIVCSATSPLMKRAAALIAQNHVQPIVEER
jgi:hypothetical protein